MTDLEQKNLENILQLYTFRNELGELIEWTSGQKEIMSVIINLGVDNKRFVQIETPTRYGKSCSIAGALIMRCTKKEAWAIVAGTGEKAQIIMDYFIDYAIENTIPRELLKNQVPLERLQQERSRRHLTFSSGFEIRVFSADSKNKQATGNAIMGFGAPYVILDEAALTDDIIESKVFRMIAGFSTGKHLYVKIGNPFYRNHFLKSHNDPDFSLIRFDYRRGIAEGRFTQEYIEKARPKPDFDVLYEVNFPSPESVDRKGWAPLVTPEDIEAVFVDKGFGFGFMKVGIDPAGEGNNYTTVVKRYKNYATIVLKEKSIDQFTFAEKMVVFNQTADIVPLGYWIDRIGIGEGYYQTLKSTLENVHGINVGKEPFDKDTFINLRAEAYWRVREDIKAKRLHLERDEDWFQLAQIKYWTKLEGRKGKTQIMSKEEMLADGIKSPDVADALMLTYVIPDPVDVTSIEDREHIVFERHALFNEL